MATDFFPQRPNAHPMIYAYEDTNPQYQGLLKVGYTAIDVDKRVAQQYPTKRPDGSVPYRIVYRESAMYPDGSSFTDHDVHRVLKRKKITGMGGEWFRCTVDDVRAAVLAVRNHTANVENRVNSFSMRPEQQEAVDKTAAYFQSAYAEDSTRYPKFLWNCKMRFGKTFASYQLAKRMGFKRILILTFKPAVVSAWQEDLNSHIDFEGWQFISRNTELTYETADKSRPIVCFGSFQDYLGVNKETGGIKAKNEWVHSTNWDLVIFDEYHFGAWKENAKKLFEQEDEDSYDSEDMDKYDRGNAYDETFLPITTMYYLYLSGTPFRALNSGEFIEDQIYNWTYSDEQRAKENWQGDGNPYAALPRMVMMTYRIPDSIRQIAMQGEFNEFDLNVFFSAKGKGAEARFVYENEVQKWLDLIRGAYLETSVDDLKLGAKKPAMPYADVRLLNVLQHTLWFLPNVASCYAMKNLLMQKQNTFYHDYTINVCAGTGAGIGAAALEPVQKSMRDPLESKKVTGLDVKDFELLVSLGVFNDSLMNDAVYKFKRYEDASLSYTGIDRHEGENRGGWDTVITDADYNSMFALQQASMEAPIPSVDDFDLPEKPFLDFAEAVRDMDQPEKDKRHSQKIAERPAVYGQHLEKPRYTPPTPKPAEVASQKQVDLSRVVLGGQLRHKAFGMGTVKEIQGGLIVVVFGETEKKFQFPGALLQGFLSLPE